MDILDIVNLHETVLIWKSERYESVSVTGISNSDFYKLSPEEQTEFIESMLADLEESLTNPKTKETFKITEWSILDKSNVPTDSYFRNAWDMSGDAIIVNLDRSREVHMAKIKILRDAKLKELDIETLKGIDVQVEKQKLRDIPQTFDLSRATTPEELKALWPMEL